MEPIVKLKLKALFSPHPENTAHATNIRHEKNNFFDFCFVFLTCSPLFRLLLPSLSEKPGTLGTAVYL